MKALGGMLAAVAASVAMAGVANAGTMTFRPATGAQP